MAHKKRNKDFPSFKDFEDTMASLGKTLKAEQAIGLQNLADGYDLLAVLPTGYGKSYLFVCPILTLRRKKVSFSAIIVTPLKSLTMSHIETFSQLGIEAVDIDDLKKKDCRIPDVMLTNPEALETTYGRAVVEFVSTKRATNLVVFDEVHTAYFWGLQSDRQTGRPFREAFQNLRKHTSRYQKPPILITLTATLSPMISEHVASSIGMGKNTAIIERSPVSSRYTLVSIQRKFGDQDVAVLVKRMNEQGLQCPQMLIFCSTVEMGRIYSSFLASIDPSLRSAVDMVHSESKDYVKARVLKSLLSDELLLPRVILTTTYLSMGIDTKGLCYVVLTKMPNSVEEFIQIAGRTGRDTEGHVVLYTSIKSNNISRQADEFRLNKDECRKRLISDSFNKTVSSDRSEETLCCDRCGSVEDGLIANLMKIETSTEFNDPFEELPHPYARLVSGQNVRDARNCLEESVDQYLDAEGLGLYLSNVLLTEVEVDRILKFLPFLIDETDVRNLLPYQTDPCIAVISNMLAIVFKDTPKVDNPIVGNPNFWHQEPHANYIDEIVDESEEEEEEEEKSLSDTEESETDESECTSTSESD